jgi:hypothetical protein
MPYKDPEVRKAYHKEKSRKHYLTNRAKTLIANAKIRKEAKDKWIAYKSGLSCTKCGFNHVAALDFHHTDPALKDGNIHRFVSNGRFAKAYEEIKKCIVLCANCHRIHHYKEKKNPAL